ncbi:hypothetical protein LTR36_002104 [Oleoguttula mirabilis]|uniref:Kanamycin B dioxygenase n=1 Tax=Oleoguttula mirabilis TaxID=1507867 RepID=A0AAV9JM82_9PEZI|nr:hypothetical protein LTR36_002104 [Oleoguttula mirabilis]
MAASDGPREIHATARELQSLAYDNTNLQSALEGLHQDGLLVLKGVVDLGHVDHLREVMGAETASILHDSERAGLFNQGVKSNILQAPPVARADCHFDDVFFNPFVVQLANAYLGSKPITNFMTANNALAGTGGMRQPVHKDITFHHPTCPFYVIANIVLSDFSVENGSTEFWLGSHAHTTREDQVPCTEDTKVRDQVPGDPSCNVKPDVVERRRQVRPPIQAPCSKGDIMIRDLRTWHAGMPNDSDNDRIMVAVGYQAPWYPNHSQRLFLPLQHANYFMAHGGQPVEVRATLLEESEMEQLGRNYDFTFQPSVPVDRKLQAKL